MLKLAFLLLPLLLGDVVHLKNGGKIEGKVSDAGDEYLIENDKGSMRVKKADVDRVEKKDYTLPIKKAKPIRLPESYAHPFYAFKIYLPPKWQRGPQHGNVQLTFYGPKDIAYVPRIDMIVEISATELAATVERFKGAFQKAYSDVQFIKESAVAGRAGEGYQFVAEFNDGAVATHALWMFFVAGGRTFSMSFTITKAWSDKYLDTVIAAMKSLRVYDEPKASADDKAAFTKEYKAADEALKKGDMDAALKSFKACAELLPDFAEVHGAIATLLLKKKNFADAESELRKALSIDPDDVNFNYNLGVAALQQHKWETAVKCLEKASAGDPGNEPTLTNLGVAYIAQDNPKKAVETLLKAVAADPESPTAHYNLGRAYEALDKNKEAAAEYREVLKIDPKHEGAAESLKRLGK